MRRRSWALVVSFLLTSFFACGPGQEPAPVSPVVPAVSAAPIASASASASVAAKVDPPPHAQAHPILFAGHRTPQNVVWSKGGFAFVTHDELWRVSVKNELSLQTTRLARPIGHDAAMGAHPASLVVGVGLDDGSVDVFRGIARLRTLPAKSADGGPLQLEVAEGGRSIAVTRSNGTWPERTTVYDVETGAEQAQVEGGNIAFDATGAFITARGGLYALSNGRRIYDWKEGFYVLGTNGIVPMGKIPFGSEMVAQDYTARAFVKNRAIFAGFGDVVAVDTVTGAATTFAASCGAKKKKRRSLIDTVHGRVFGVCADAVLVTDLTTGNTQRIAGGPFTESSFPPDLAMLPGAESMVVKDIHVWLVDPAANTVIAAPRELEVLDRVEHRCAGRSMPRVDMPCTSPAVSDDREYRLDFGGGALRLTRVADGKAAFELTASALLDHAQLAPRGASFDVFGADAGPPLYRLDGGAPGPALPAATATCKGAHQSLHAPIEDGAVYTAYAGAGMTACACTDANGCRVLSFGGGAVDYLMGAAADGRALSFTTNSTMTETTVRLFANGRQVARAGVTGHCDRAAFAGKRLFLKCEPQPLQESWLYELDPRSLAVLGRRVTPLGKADAVTATSDALAVVADGTASILPLDWVVNASAQPIATHYLGDAGMLTERGASLETTGDATAILASARCWNGERLFPLDTCSSELQKHP